MATDRPQGNVIAENIESFLVKKTPTATQYRVAFQAIENKLTPAHRNMLEAQYRDPDRTTTIERLANVAGYKNWNGAVLQYGLLARRLCTALSYTPSQRNKDGTPMWSYVLADSPDTRTSEHWQWKMRPEVATALEQLSWFDDAILPEEVPRADKYIEGAVKG